MRIAASVWTFEELRVVVDLEERLGGVGHAPDHDCRDLDRIAVAVVDLELLALEVAHLDRDARAAGERVDPPEALLLEAAGVTAEQHQRACLVGVHHRQAFPAEGDEHAYSDDPDVEIRRAARHLAPDVGDVEDDRADRHRSGHEQDESTGNPLKAWRLPLLDHLTLHAIVVISQR